MPAKSKKTDMVSKQTEEEVSMQVEKEFPKQVEEDVFLKKTKEEASIQVEEEVTIGDLIARADKLDKDIAKILSDLIERLDNLEARVNYLDRYNPVRG